MTKDTLFVVISQSGETADTLETLKMAKAAGLRTLVICNVDNSSMVRLADACILTRAGIEKGVASTKAFATQVTVFWMLALHVAKIKNGLSSQEIAKQISLLREVPKHVKVTDEMHERIKRLSKRYLHGHGFFFIGRDIFFPLALEGALKLKEISYLHAEGYPSGEMKHGQSALADPELFTIALLPEHLQYEKSKSNVEELSARDSTICAISSKPFDKADDFIEISTCRDYMLEFFEMMVVVQLLSLEISVRLGNDVDMPRNLAKSVTVE
jgi:glucosamine--fructose-6-phosphate aminotransferase (isomerizing)